MTVVLDTSAVAGVVCGEPDAEALPRPGRAPEATRDLHLLLDRLGVVTVALDAQQAAAAVAAWRRFGKGRHVAGLNLGDCFSYALAAVQGAALLFEGDDFPQTDVRAAL